MQMLRPFVPLFRLLVQRVQVRHASVSDDMNLIMYDFHHSLLTLIGVDPGMAAVNNSMNNSDYKF